MRAFNSVKNQSGESYFKDKNQQYPLKKTLNTDCVNKTPQIFTVGVLLNIKNNELKVGKGKRHGNLLPEWSWEFNELFTGNSLILVHRGSVGGTLLQDRACICRGVLRDLGLIQIAEL